MSEFTFNLNGILVSDGGLPKIPAGLSNLGGSLYFGTADNDLTYTGNDAIVWDRINQERLKRGLPSLADIGYPRPSDDVPAPAASTASTETFKIKGPPGMTLEQAQAIFKQQAGTGALVGFNVGDSLSAATQAADGLAAAAPQLSQGFAEAAKLLPQGTNTAAITAALGPNGSAVSGQIRSALQGAGPAVASTLAIGATNFNQFTGSITSQIPGVVNSFRSALPGAVSSAQANLPGELTKMQAALPDGIAGITNALNSVPINGINIADLTKQIPGLGSIGNLSSTDVTGTLAQASKLIGQASTEISNELGAGKFGFDASQLEKAGLIKPGTAAAFLQQGANDLVDVLKSPTVWTGKDGVKGLGDLLGNNNLQNKIQQGLMTTGLGDLKQLGIPTDKLSPQALSGLATNAAKSVQDTLKWATGKPGLPADVKSKFDSMATNGAFAVTLTQEKTEEPVLKEKIIEPSENTVNSTTVDAAAARVVGNDKVPTVVTGTATGEYIAISGFAQFVRELTAAFDALQQRINAINSQYQTITQDQWNTINNEAVALRATVRARIEALNAAALAEQNNIPDSGQNFAQKTALRTFNDIIDTYLPAMDQSSDKVRQLIKDLANKIYTQAIRVQTLGT